MGKNYTKNTWIDRVISGALRYDIKADGGSSIYNQVQILVHNTITQVGSALAAAWMNNIEAGVDLNDTLIADRTAPITTGGTSTAYTLTTIGAPALTTGESWEVIINQTAGAIPTLERDGKGAKNLKYYSNGVKVSCGASTLTAGLIVWVVYDGTDYIVCGLGGGGGSSYWNSLPATPTRVNNTTITIPDASNAGHYDSLLCRLTVLKWTESGVVRQAVIVVSAYATNVDTFTIIGDTCASIDAGSMKYATKKCDIITLQQFGILSIATNDSTTRWYPKGLYHVFGANAELGSAGTTNANTLTLSKNKTDGTGTILGSALSISSGNTESQDQTATSGTTVTDGDYVTGNLTGVSTTFAVDAYIHIFAFPDNNQYMS